jgi:hypothetical protein
MTMGGTCDTIAAPMISPTSPTLPRHAAAVVGHHHRWKTDHGYRTWRDLTGHWHLTRPNGTDISPT